MTVRANGVVLGESYPDKGRVRRSRSIMSDLRIFVQGERARHRIRAMTAPALELRRIDTTRNMRRFYRLELQPELFGGVLLVRQWGRIGARGRIVADRFESEELAAQALAQHTDRKMRRGYWPRPDSPAKGI